MEYEARILKMIVLKKGKPIFSDEFVVVSQEGTPGYGKIAIDVEEWPILRTEIDRMIKLCRDDASEEV